MSSFEFTETDSWGGRSVARRAADAGPRGRLVVTGLIVSADTQEVAGAASALYTLDDGSGQIDLLFLGQPTVGGLELGACVTVEGTVIADHTRMVIWNPIYRIEPEPR